MTITAGPGEVLRVVDSARSALSALGEVSPVRGSRQEWSRVVGELQGLLNVATAAQDAAISRLAAVEGEWAEDGTLAEVHKAPGHVALDAPALVSGALTVSAAHAERRVRDAVRRAADTGVSSTGLGGLHRAMASGVLDAYRAQVVAYELEEVPAEVAATVVDAVGAYFPVEDAPRLRRRVRRVLARVSPDLLRQRAIRARSQCRLERWVDEPGVDTWHGTFPSEDAAQAWAAVDALAQQYVADGRCDRVDRARARALTDLVTGNATVDVRVTLAVPADGGAAEPSRPAGAAAARGASELVEVVGAFPGDPVLVERGWLARAVATTRVARREPTGRVRLVPCDVVTGAPVDAAGVLTSDAYRPGRRLAALVRARDRRCRFPGCAVAARFCDLDHVRPWPVGATAAANLLCLCRRHHRVKQRPGWSVVLAPDATADWTDPTGRTRTTRPVDHLDQVVLPDTGTDPPLTSSGTTRRVVIDGPHTPLEFLLEHRTAGRWRRPVVRVDVRDLGSRCLTMEDGGVRHRPARAPCTEEPPF